MDSVTGLIGRPAVGRSPDQSKAEGAGVTRANGHHGRSTAHDGLAPSVLAPVPYELTDKAKELLER